MHLKELAEKSGGGKKLRFLNKKCMASAKKLYTFHYFPAQVVDLHPRSSSEVNFAVVHQIISKFQSHVGSSVGNPSHHPRPAIMLRNKARSAFQHNIFFISLSCDLFMITFHLNVYRFIFIIFPLGLLFPFVKIHSVLYVRESQCN